MRNIIVQKPHYEVLDGLRGIAAIIVLIFHFMEIVITNPSENPIMHGFLAVDFFFCLSGFVIAYAYDSRIEQMSFLSFVKRRLIRLQPLVIIGSVLGLITFLFNPFQNLYAVYGFKQTLMLFLTSCLVIPYPIVEERYFNLFNLNAPMWSLFWEYVFNIFYALILFRLAKSTRLILLLCSSISMGVWLYVHGNLLDGWGGESSLHGLLNVFEGGWVRVSFSFLMGMTLYSFRVILKNKLGFPMIGVLLLLLFFVPFNPSWNSISELLIVMFCFPIIVVLGVGASVAPKYKRLCTFLGDISYPLYMIHYPFMWVFGTYIAVKQPETTQLLWIIPTLAIVLIGLSYAVFRWIDKPLRQYLSSVL